MTSITSSLPSNAPDEPPRPEAGRLPLKRGEIGYVDDGDNNQQVEASGTDEPTLPPRHPADRDSHPAQATSGSASVPIPNTTSVKPAGRLWDKAIFAGFHFGTFIVFTMQVLLCSATIVGWVIAATHLSKLDTTVVNVVLIVHVGSASLLFVQIIFLERRIYRLRAERYSSIHPGELLPSSRRFLGTSSTTLGFIPWNRPPLPTYAAALAQSGTGTGDVEDHLIAAPPPPAYGNTRGSRMLLSGYLRDSLRAERPISGNSQMTERHGVGDERPVSYVSRDEEWEVIQDADRARRLEETLARLEHTGRSEARS